MENYQKLWVIPTTTTEPVWPIQRVLKRWTINIQFKCPWEMNKKNCLASPSDACCSFICKFSGEFSWFNDGDTNLYVIIAVIWPKGVAWCESLNHWDTRQGAHSNANVIYCVLRHQVQRTMLQFWNIHIRVWWCRKCRCRKFDRTP